ncbi:proton-translocating NADH-quinone oxidoreductase, chain L family protein [Mycobacterium kansasii]|uniref:Proton-translocating NADH-quinone oxidoreductase, chain L family protein n=1 Tax=Mycobacterium kansasii TaxID=1768 RepID=A0A1V3XX61_MYCKA|nr:proton-translocating NADH-quinone oxidoreductase, chain L family protein [Mycobacterium kansasii]
MTDYTWLLVALPLVGAAILLFGGRRTDAWGHWLGCAAAVAAFGVGAALLAEMLGRAEGDRVIRQTVFTWIPVGGLQVDFGLQLDQLSMCFVLLITGVGSLIHIYSVAYMKDDPDRRRFFGYLNLFLASMLLLVVADNYALLYVGWEGVGLASYLLIGFWYHKPSAATAAKKAFVMNRVGDAGLALGMFVMFATFGTLSYAGVFAGAPAASRGALTAMGLLLLLGACAKSAQVPLQAWLGDAMEGPTPVSALIHAATMVTAGVYLIVRSNPLYNLSPEAQLAVVVVGAVTLLFGAFIGCAKDDIKRALAASTMSQIGYMVLAAGLGPAGYAFAIMHLLTHGFFKAGLFLGSGAVIHAMDEEQDMRRYGGLRAALPVTFVTFGLAYLAIIGVPPFAGFFSKDAIIEAALGVGGARGYVLGGAALLGAGVTAFYMTRVMLMTFFGKKRWAPGSHPHEAPGLMTWPMILLAVGSVFSGACSRSAERFGTGSSPSSAYRKKPPTPSRPGSAPRWRSPSSPPESRWPTGCMPPHRSRGWPHPGVGADDGRARRPLRRRLQRGGVHASQRPADGHAGRSRQRGGGRLGQRVGRAGEPDVEPTATHANRLRP